MSTESTTTVNTGYGPLTVERSLLRIWDTYGWPTDEVLRRMVSEQLHIEITVDGEGVRRVD